MLFAYGFGTQQNARFGSSRTTLGIYGFHTPVPLIRLSCGDGCMHSVALLLILFCNHRCGNNTNGKKNITALSVMVKLFDTRNTALLALCCFCLFFISECRILTWLVAFPSAYYTCFTFHGVVAMHYRQTAEEEYRSLALWWLSIAVSTWRLTASTLAAECWTDKWILRSFEMIKKRIVLPVNAASNWDQGHFRDISVLISQLQFLTITNVRLIIFSDMEWNKFGFQVWQHWTPSAKFVLKMANRHSSQWDEDKLCFCERKP